MNHQCRYRRVKLLKYFSKRGHVLFYDDQKPEEREKSKKTLTYSAD